MCLNQTQQLNKMGEENTELFLTPKTCQLESLLYMQVLMEGGGLQSEPERSKVNGADVLSVF